jgi:hypothetical protein
MEPRVEGLLRTKQFEALARVVNERWGLSPTTDSLLWVHGLAFRRPVPAAGGTAESPWSNATWLSWIKNRLDDYSTDPSLADDPASRYGPSFEVERDPTSVTAWRDFLERYSKELLDAEDLPLFVDVPEQAREAAWMGFAPAEEQAILATEARLGRRLPPSLRGFYAVSNGWRATGLFTHDVLPVEEIGWLRDRVPHLYEVALECESTPGPFHDDPGDRRLKEFRDEQGTRVMRSLVLNSVGEDHWLVDPGAEPHEGEWPAGCWASSNPAMEWDAANFAELMAEALRSLRET